MYRFVADVLSATVVVGSMVIPSIASAAELTRYELSLFQACESVEDCVVANNGYCDCHNGGGNVGINKDQQSAFEATFPEEAICTTMGGEHPCDEGELQCTGRGLCHWQWAYANDPPTCQTTTEVLQKADDALTDEELAPYQNCIDDLQCIIVVNKGSCDRNMIGEEVAINSANRSDFLNAFSNTQMACSATNEEFIWGIGTAECELGRCQYTPAPHCDETVEDSDSPNYDGSATGNVVVEEPSTGDGSSSAGAKPSNINWNNVIPVLLPCAALLLTTASWM